MAGLAERAEKVAEPALTVTPLWAATDADAEFTRVTEALAPLHPAGTLATVSAVTLPEVTVQLVVAAAREPQVLTDENPAATRPLEAVTAAAWATSGGAATAASTSGRARARRLLPTISP